MRQRPRRCGAWIRAHVSHPGRTIGLAIVLAVIGGQVSKSGDGNGIGCLGLALGAAAVGLILAYWQVILLALLAAITMTATGAALWRAFDRAASKAAERERCKVCNNWARSVLLTEMSPADASQLCAEHRSRLARLSALEGELLRDP